MGTKLYGGIANPAVAMGITFSSFFEDGFSTFSTVYMYPIVPFIGSFLSVLFYELIYKKTQKILAHNVEDGLSDGSKSNPDSMGEHD